MKRFVTHIRLWISGLAVAGLATAHAAASPLRSAGPAYKETVILAQSDCYAIGQQVAAENGGTLARASQAQRGGQAVCVIVVLVPGKNGERPRRTEIIVPLN